MDYNDGLNRLKRLVSGTDKEQNFYVLEARLRENLDKQDLHGTYDRGDRAQIIGQLNRLAKETINKSFNDLCQVSEYINNGNVLFKKRHLEEALEEYQKAIQIHPELLLFKKKSDVLLDLRRWNDVINVCNAINLNEHTEEHDVIAQICANKGKALFTIGKYREALTAVDAAIAEDKNNASLWQLRGAICSAQKNLEETRESYGKAIFLAPPDKKPYLHNEYGEALFNFRRYFEAINEYYEATRLKKDFANAYQGLSKAGTALAYWAQGQYKDLQKNKRPGLNDQS